MYGIITAEDANFKQKSRWRCNDADDPPLGPGWATFVNPQAYGEHLLKYADEDEVSDGYQWTIYQSTNDTDQISHCVGFSALANANTKRAKGLRATGIGSVTCARHECFLPNGTGDLQKGERYVFPCCAASVNNLQHLPTGIRTWTLFFSQP